MPAVVDMVDMEQGGDECGEAGKSCPASRLALAIAKKIRVDNKIKQKLQTTARLRIHMRHRARSGVVGGVRETSNAPPSPKNQIKHTLSPTHPGRHFGARWPPFVKGSGRRGLTTHVRGARLGLVGSRQRPVHA